MAKKDFGRRLMPEYLLKYSEELQKNHPDPSASWGGGSGGDYTAGEGIDITGDVISIDEEVVAKKTDIPDTTNFVTTNTAQTVSGEKTFNDDIIIHEEDPVYHTAVPFMDLKIEAERFILSTKGPLSEIHKRTFVLPWSISQSELESTVTLATTKDIPTVPSVLSAFTNDVGYITGITSSDVTTALGYVPGTSNFSGDYEDLSGKPTIPDSTSDLVNDSGFISGVTSNMITTALGYTPGTSNFSGSYTDLTDKPTIPTVNDPTITFMQGTAIKGTIHLNQSENQAIVFDAGGSGTVDWDDITDKPTFATVATSGSYNDLSDKPTIPTGPSVLSAFTNDVGYITGITSSDVTTALGYTPGTSNFSGSYTDLTDKPTIPTVNDATITFTQGGTTKGTITLNQSTDATIALDAGGGSSAPYEITNMVVDSTNQTITLTITANE